MAKLDERVFKFKLNYRELDWFVSSDEEHLNLTVKTRNCNQIIPLKVKRLQSFFAV